MGCTKTRSTKTSPRTIPLPAKPSNPRSRPASKRAARNEPARKTAAVAAPRKAKLPRPLPEHDGPAPPEATASARDPETMAAVRSAVAAALDKKAEELKVLEVGAVTTFTDYF